MPLPGSSIVNPKLHEHLTGWRRRGLPDTCTITRPSTAVATVDPETLVRTPASPTVIYDGGCTAQPAPYGDRVVITGDTQVVIRKYVVSIDADAASIDVDDVVVLTTTEDPLLLGRPLVVVDVTGDTFQSRRLIICEDRPGMHP